MPLSCDGVLPTGEYEHHNGFDFRGKDSDRLPGASQTITRGQEARHSLHASCPGRSAKVCLPTLESRLALIEERLHALYAIASGLKDDREVKLVPERMV